LGKEAAIFLPSGTMCNEIALLVHCQPGDEILCDRTSHILNYEAGGPAALAGAVMTPIDGKRGVYSAEQLKAAIRPEHRYGPRTRVVEIENTANMGGGRIWPMQTLNAVTDVAKENGLIVHLDGARLMNAVVASEISAKDYAAGSDTAWIDFSKGLGAPVGAALAGSKDFIEEAWRWKQRLGGAMRQAGIIAAAGLYSLDHNIPLLAADNENAKIFAEKIANSTRFAIDPKTVDTNIVIFELANGEDAQVFCNRLEVEAGVRIGAIGPSTLRAVTHLDVNKKSVVAAAEHLLLMS
jgi:threonine aldolase